MTGSRILRLGYVPLVDAAALIAAREKGFFAAQGLEVELSREVSWATVRDKVMVGALDGAHMLAPLALAATLGAGSDPVSLIAPMALNLDGAAVTLSTRLGEALGGGAEGQRNRSLSHGPRGPRGPAVRRMGQTAGHPSMRRVASRRAASRGSR